jgi:hypothetical protein
MSFPPAGSTSVGEFAIQKNPQAMAQRLNLHSLMFITGKRDATDLAPCPNDYVLIFKKPGDTLHPVRALFDAERTQADGSPPKNGFGTPTASGPTSKKPTCSMAPAVTRKASMSAMSVRFK